MKYALAEFERQYGCLGLAGWDARGYVYELHRAGEVVGRLNRSAVMDMWSQRTAATLADVQISQDEKLVTLNGDAATVRRISQDVYSLAIPARWSKPRTGNIYTAFRALGDLNRNRVRFQG